MNVYEVTISHGEPSGRQRISGDITAPRKRLFGPSPVATSINFTEPGQLRADIAHLLPELAGV